MMGAMGIEYKNYFVFFIPLRTLIKSVKTIYKNEKLFIYSPSPF
jgi:hypothetical protein